MTDTFKTPADTWARIAAPLNPDTIAWRQDGKPTTRDGKIIARFVCYVEAGTIRERLDSVVPGEWDLTLAPFGEAIALVSHEGSDTQYAVKARLQILGVVRECIGQGDDLKQAATDAFKRAAVRFGIGHELYNMEQLWVELDGDGKYAKPIEDPQKVYERKFGNSAGGGSGRKGDAPSGQPSEAHGQAPADKPLEESCPKCGGKMWDNRLTKRNPRAPDFKCRNRSCDGVIWGEKREAATAGAPRGFDEMPSALEDREDDLPF